MQNKIRFATETVNLCSQFVLCMFFFVLVQVWILEQPAAWYVHLTFLCLLLLAIAIRYLITDNLLIYIGLHLLLFLTPLFLPMNNLLVIETVIYLILITIQSLHYWKHNGYHYNTSVPWFPFLLMCVFYIYAIVEHNATLKIIIYIFGVAYLLLYLAKLYLIGLLGFSQSKATNSSVPLTRITKINSILVGFTLGVIAITILFSAIFNVDHIIYDIGKGLLFLITMIAKLVSAFIGWLVQFFPGPSEGREEAVGNWEPFQHLPMEENWITILLNVLMQVTQLTIMMILLFLVFRGIYRMLHQFLLQNLLSDDITETLTCNHDISDSDTTDAITEQKDSRKLSRIRKKYKRAILKHKNTISLHASMTTNEIHNQLSDTDQRNMVALKQSYENERYHNQIE